MNREPEPRIRIALVDDHPMVRIGLAALIGAEAGFELVGEAGSGAEALALLPALRPDVVLVDLVMPGLDGVATIERLVPLLPKARFVVLTSLVDAQQIQRAIAAGASGYLLKNTGTQQLITVLRETHAGRRVMAPEATDAMIAAAQHRQPGADLTARERELLALMVRGMANQDIARELAIALPTVKFHVGNILGKLGVDNRTEAVLMAIKYKLAPGP
ncbi:MAG: response regulator [Aquabacterium sp.]